MSIVGLGWVGGAYHKTFPDAVLYDPFNPKATGTKEQVNETDMALVCVPTDLKQDGSLDMSIVEDVIGWIEAPLICIKSALQPGTTDRLVKATGKKISVSVEMVGEGKYFIPFWKYPHPEDPTLHDFLIVGGEEDAATGAAEILWQRMSPDIQIHLLSAIEAEICKLMENTWGALKVSYANTMARICEGYGANYIKVMQAWGSDGRVEKMHMRKLSYQSGWKSKCWDKDIPALVKTAQDRHIPVPLLEGLVYTNREDLNG